MSTRRDYRLVAADGVASAAELQRDLEAGLHRQRELHGAPQATVEAVMWEFRTDGLAALKTPGGARRFSELATEQVREVIRRLLYCRKKYPGRDPGITDDLLLQLEEQLS